MLEKIAYSSGNFILQIIDTSVQFIGMVKQTLRSSAYTYRRGSEVLNQLYEQGNRSLSIVLFAVVFSGFVVALEYTFHMRLILFTAEMVPAFSAIMIFREIAPTLTGLLLATKVGAGIAAEIGTMKITEQIDALKLLHINPIEFLVLPRLIASIFTTTLLALLAVIICFFGAGIVAVNKLGFSIESYVQQLHVMLSQSDLWMLIAKASTFGCVIPLVSCYYGFACKQGAQGVGEATTKAVVYSSVLIIILDFVITTIFSVVVF
jgi:phospholipid/cholesterol/gamma-HCH transport system permease protein